MPERPIIPALTEFMPSLDGGVNTRKVAWNLGDTEFDDGFNIDVTQIGVWSSRPGVSSLGGLETLPGGSHWHRRVDGDIILWGIWGSELYRSLGAGEWVRRASAASWASNTLHQFTEGIYLGAGFGDNQFRAVYVNQCVPQSGVTTTDQLMVFRGDNVTADAQFTQNESYAPRVCSFFQGRLWKADDQIAGDGNDLAWSELDDGLTYSPANELSIEPGLGGRITGLFPMRAGTPRLIVFKEEAIAYLEPKWGSSSALIPGAGDELDTILSKVELISPGIGCIATRSILPSSGFAGGDVLFLARDGVRSLARANDDTLAGSTGRITDKVPRWIARINFTAAHKAVATIFDDAYHLAVPMDGAAENSHILRMELRTGAWTLHDYAVRDFRQVPVSGDERLYMQYNSGFTEESTATGLPTAQIYHLYRGFSGDLDPGATFVNYEMTSKAFVFQNPKVEKQFDRILFLGTTDAGETHHMRVAYRTDFQAWVTLPTEVVFGVPGSTIILAATSLVWDTPDQKLIQRRIGIADAAPGTMLQIRFTGARDSATPSIYFTDVEAKHYQQMFDNDR